MQNEQTMDVVHSKDEVEALIKNKILELANNDLLISEDEIYNFYKFYVDKDMKLEELVEEFNKVMTREDIEQRLGIKKVEETPENKITLDNITDITKDGRKFILIHYPSPSTEIKLVENLSGKDAKTLFEENKDNDGLLNIDGFVNSMDVFKQNIEPEKIEVKTYNVLEIEENDSLKKTLTDEQIQMLEAVYDTMLLVLADGDKKRADAMKEDYIANKNYPIGVIKAYNNATGKNVFFSPSENVVILSVPEDPTKDQINVVSKDVNGKYKLQKIDEAVGYSYNENNEEKEVDQSPEGENKQQTLENEELDDPTKKKGKRLSIFDERRRNQKDDVA